MKNNSSLYGVRLLFCLIRSSSIAPSLRIILARLNATSFGVTSGALLSSGLLSIHLCSLNLAAMGPAFLQIISHRLRGTYS